MIKIINNIRAIGKRAVYNCSERVIRVVYTVNYSVLEISHLVIRRITLNKAILDCLKTIRMYGKIILKNFKYLSPIAKAAVKTYQDAGDYRTRLGNVVKRTPKKVDIEEGLRDYSIQKHDADDAGTHYDTRIDMNGKAASFAHRKAFPESTGKLIAFFMQPIHSLKYMNFEGEIESGYGSGTVELVDKGKCEVRVYDSGIERLKRILLGGEKFHIRFFKSAKWPGHYTIKKLNNNSSENLWVMYRHNELLKEEIEELWRPRRDYKLVDKRARNLGSESEFNATKKVDGSHAWVYGTEKGNVITSRRLDRNGNIIEYQDKIPKFRDTVVPKEWEGVPFRVEIAKKNERNPSWISGLLNSNIERAQKKENNVIIYAIDIDDPTMSDGEKKNQLKNLVSEMPEWFKFPDEKKDNESIAEFADRIISDGGEGIIVHNETGKEINGDKLLKIKDKNSWDLKVVDFRYGSPGTSHEDKLSRLRVEDANGNVTTVSSGLTEEQIDDITNNPEEYRDKIVEVEGHEATKRAKIRGPRVTRFRDDKIEPDEINVDKSESRNITEMIKGIMNRYKLKYPEAKDVAWRIKSRYI